MASHCPQEQIAAWIDRQLEASEAAQIEAHLQQCESCRRLQEELESTTKMFRNLEVLEPPAYLWTRIAAELEQTETPKRPILRAWREGWLFRRLEFAALAAVLLLIIGSTVFFVLERQASTRFKSADVAQIDRYYAAFLAKSPDADNPFRKSHWADPESNPFARHALKDDSNPFGSLRGKR